MGVMSMWVIYDHPADFPDCFVAREWLVEPGKEPTPSPVTVFKARDLRAAQRFVEIISPDGVDLVPDVNDDPCIVGIRLSNERTAVLQEGGDG